MMAREHEYNESQGASTPLDWEKSITYRREGFRRVMRGAQDMLFILVIALIVLAIPTEGRKTSPGYVFVEFGVPRRLDRRVKPEEEDRYLWLLLAPEGVLRRYGREAEIDTVMWDSVKALPNENSLAARLVNGRFATLQNPRYIGIAADERDTVATRDVNRVMMAMRKYAAEQGKVIDMIDLSQYTERGGEGWIRRSEGSAGR